MDMELGTRDPLVLLFPLFLASGFLLSLFLCLDGIL